MYIFARLIIFNILTWQLLSAAVLPSRHIDVVCTGDKAGNLGIWMVQVRVHQTFKHLTTVHFLIIFKYVIISVFFWLCHQDFIVLIQMEDEESLTDIYTAYARRRNYFQFKPHSKEINTVRLYKQH